ncbi:MAG: citramalate synthase [Spirochaetaceae bacterium]|nr:citramalate synthase [Spirochaetaceae bacterium]
MDGEADTSGSLASRENRIELLDTTLRDGAQGEGINFSLQDKFAVIQALDELGIPWIEAGSPGSNPKDAELFRTARELSLKNAALCSFGPTRRPDTAPEKDPQLQSLLNAETGALTIFGKSWDFHAREVLRVNLEENLAMISETIAWLKAQGRTVFFDAEHFFDGWQENSAYALATIRAALTAGADRVVLCDTNGGAFPADIAAAVAAAGQVLREGSFSGARGKPLLGIHAHNDAGLAVANALAAVGAGCRHVQGTLVGFGERCGNTCLAALIPSLELKLGYTCLPAGKLAHISEITRRIAETANVPIPAAMPYVGASAFSHKGGMHSDGILKTAKSFEHIDPGAVGNERHLLMSEVGGRSAIAERAKKIEASITREHPAVRALAEKLKTLEAEGWAFEGAGASFELLVRRELGRYKPLFNILAYRVMSEHPTGESVACSQAWAKVWVDGQDEIAAAEGDGPVNALDGALRRALVRFYPELEQVRLTDYKVRVIDGMAATAAKVRVLIESTDGPNVWTTVGVSADIIDASRAALVDSIEYKLIGDIERKFKAYL